MIVNQPSFPKQQRRKGNHKRQKKRKRRKETPANAPSDAVDG
jgi:hypothetical protein